MDVLSVLNANRDSWYLVWPSYAGIFGPMALYVFHDVIDARWRRRRGRVLWFWAYLAANAAFLPAFATYFAAQVGGHSRDHKEAAATLVAFTVNLVTLRKIVRGFLAFEMTAVLAQRFGLARAPQPQHDPHSTPQRAVCFSAAVTGVVLVPLRAAAQLARRLRAAAVGGPDANAPSRLQPYHEYVGDLVNMNASCLLDDDVPGDGARIAWLGLVWVMFWRWLWHKCGLHRLLGTGRSFQKVTVLQDANDLIIMAVVWLWGSLSQVPSPAQHNCGAQRHLPAPDVLRMLAHVLDRSVVLGYLFSHSTQLAHVELEYGRDTTGATVLSVLRPGARSADAHAGEYNPAEGACRDCGGGADAVRGGGGLLGLSGVFPGAMTVLGIAALLHQEGRPHAACCAPEQLWESQLSDSTRSTAFQQAAAVHFTVRMICAAVRSFFSFGRVFGLQVGSQPTPDELTRAVLHATQDAEHRSLPHCPSGRRSSRRRPNSLKSQPQLKSRLSAHGHGHLSDWQLWHVLHHAQHANNPTQKLAFDRMLTDAAAADDHFRSLAQQQQSITAGSMPAGPEPLSLLQAPDPSEQAFFSTGTSATRQPKPTHRPPPLLVAYCCSVLSMIVAACTALPAEVTEKVAKLPALQLHERVGTARLALIGIADLHRQLSRLGGCQDSEARPSACTRSQPHLGPTAPPDTAQQSAQRNAEDRPRGRRRRCAVRAGADVTMSTPADRGIEDAYAAPAAMATVQLAGHADEQRQRPIESGSGQASQRRDGILRKYGVHPGENNAYAPGRGGASSHNAAGRQHGAARSTLDEACCALVAVADRVALHAQYMHGVSLFVHRRSVAAAVQPQGPLTEAQGAALEELLRFFEGVPLQLRRAGQATAGRSEEVGWQLSDFDAANISLAMAAAFASVMTASAALGSSATFPPPFPHPDPIPAPDFATATRHRRMLAALYHAVCTAWECLSWHEARVATGGHMHAPAEDRGSAAPPAAAGNPKAWGISRPAAMHAALSAARACNAALASALRDRDASEDSDRDSTESRGFGTCESYYSDIDDDDDDVDTLTGTLTPQGIHTNAAGSDVSLHAATSSTDTTPPIHRDDSCASSRSTAQSMHVGSAVGATRTSEISVLAHSSASRVTARLGRGSEVGSDGFTGPSIGHAHSLYGRGESKGVSETLQGTPYRVLPGPRHSGPNHATIVGHSMANAAETHVHRAHSALRAAAAAAFTAQAATAAAAAAAAAATVVDAKSGALPGVAAAQHTASDAARAGVPEYWQHAPKLEHLVRAAEAATLLALVMAAVAVHAGEGRGGTASHVLRFVRGPAEQGLKALADCAGWHEVNGLSASLVWEGGEALAAPEAMLGLADAGTVDVAVHLWTLPQAKLQQALRSTQRVSNALLGSRALQKSRLHQKGSSAFLAACLLARLSGSLPSASPTSDPACNGGLQAPRCVSIDDMGLHDLVRTTQNAAEWAEACHGALFSSAAPKPFAYQCHERDNAAFASFWASSLHALAARKAFDDAKRAARVDFLRPDVDVVLPRQLEARQAWTECRASLNQAQPTRPWLTQFARQSAAAAACCAAATREVLERVQSAGPGPECMDRASVSMADAMHHSLNASDVASGLAEAALRHSTPAQHAISSQHTPPEGHITQQLSPTAAAKAIGAASHAAGVDSGAVGSVGGAPAGSGESTVAADMARLMQDMHGEGLVVGIKLWQLLRRLLQDETLMGEVAY